LLPSNLADETRTRARAAISALLKAGAQAARHPRFGAYASLAAIVLGGAMMMANMAREDRGVPAAAAELAAPLPVKAAPVGNPKPDPIATIAAPSPVLPKPAEKFTERVDTTPTASIPTKEPVKPKPRHHARKRKPADSAN
jgi:hypothetical protein